MRPKSLLGVAALCVVAAALFIARPSAAQNAGTSAPGKGGAAAARPAGTYTMTSSAGGTFLCDTTSGKCWRLKVTGADDVGAVTDGEWALAVAPVDAAH